jgi:3-dehydrosphinganine reductase
MTKDYYRGRTVLITGGSSGIGFAIANALVEMEARVILLARDYEKLKIAKTSILESYPEADVSVFSADVTDEDSLGQFYDKHLVDHTVPDILINCAGVARPGYIEELPSEVFRWTMDIDYHGTVNTVKLLLPGMIERGSGHIINVSSIAGVIGLFGYTAYCGAKFAVKGFSDALRSEMKFKGIRVSVLYPPDTDTPQLEWENQYKPAETRAISGAAKPISPDWVARYTLKAAARGKYAIIPGFEAKIMYFAGTSLGNLIYPIMDLLVRSASKKKV